MPIGRLRDRSADPFCGIFRDPSTSWCEKSDLHNGGGQRRTRRYPCDVTDHVTAGEAGFFATQMGIGHPKILATTVCAIVEHGGELLMVRQLNRDGEERWNFPTGWMEPVDEDGRIQLPEHSVNRNLLVETGYAASDAHLIGVSLVREHDPDGHRIGTSLRLNYVCEQFRQTS